MEAERRSHRLSRVCLFLAALVCSCPATTTAATTSSHAFNTTLLDDPLEPIWNRLDGLSTDILRDFQSMVAEIVETTSTSLEAKLQKLDTDVSTKFDAINNNVLRKLNEVTNQTTRMDASLRSRNTQYLTSVRQQIAASYQEVETVLGSKIAALENKVLEHINNKIASLMSFNLTLPQHSPSSATSASSSTTSSSSSTLSSSTASTALSAEDSQAIVNQLNAKLVAIDAKLEDLADKVNVATSTLSTINLHVAKINEREMDADSRAQEPGVTGGSQGGAQSCQTLVDKMSELMDNTQLSSDVINELENRLAEMSKIPTNLPRDCSDVHWYNPSSPSGVYEVFPTLDVKSSVSAWCEMGDLSQKESGGWTVILRRRNTTWGFVDFNRTWDDYTQGFGNPGEGEWWFSLDALHALTYRQPYELRFLIRDIEQGVFEAHYNTFRVEDEGHLFRLVVDGFSGNISQDAFKSKHHGRSFSTWDRDHDNWDKGSCAINNGGGWWFNACHYTTLTAPFPTSNDRDAKTIRWLNGETWLVLDDVTVEVRPNNYALRFNAHNFE